VVEKVLSAGLQTPLIGVIDPPPQPPPPPPHEDGFARVVTESVSLASERFHAIS